MTLGRAYTPGTGSQRDLNPFFFTVHNATCSYPHRTPTLGLVDS